MVNWAIEGSPASGKKLFCVMQSTPFKSGSSPASSSISPKASTFDRSDSRLQALKRLLGSLRALNGLVLILVVAVISFHPWVMDLADKALAIMPLLLLVLVFVYVVNPLVAFVHSQLRRLPGAARISYQRSLILTYLMLIIAAALVVAALAPRLVDELQGLAEQMPVVAQALQTKLGEYRHSYFEALPVNVQNKIAGSVGQLGNMAGQLIKGGIQYAGTISSAVMRGIGAMVLVPLVAYYFLADGSDIMEYGLRLVPVRRRSALRILLGKMHLVMQSFLKGQALLCCIIGTVTTLAMALVMPDYCIALGLVAGITEAIPVVGPILGAIPAVIIALALPEHGGLGLALVVIAIYTVIQQLENTVLVPRVMGQSLGLHPLSLMLGMIVLGNMFGFWGVVLAAPMVASIKLLLLTRLGGPELLEAPNADGQSGTGLAQAAGEPGVVEPAIEPSSSESKTSLPPAEENAK